MSKIIARIPKHDWIPDIEVTEDCVKSLDQEVPSIPFEFYLKTNNVFMIHDNPSSAVTNIKLQIHVIDGDKISVSTEDGIVSVVIPANEFFSGLLMEFSKDQTSLLRTNYFLNIVKKIESSYPTEHLNTRTSTTNELYFMAACQNTGVIYSNEELLLVCAGIEIHKSRIIIYGVFGNISLEKIVQPECVIMLPNGKYIFIREINNVFPIQESSDNKYSIEGVVSIHKTGPNFEMPKNRAAFDSDEEYEEYILQYLHGNSKRNSKTYMDDLVLE